MLRTCCAQAARMLRACHGRTSFASLTVDRCASCAHRLRARHGRTTFASLTVDRISTLRASCARAWQDKFRKILSTSSAARTLPTCCAHAAGMLCACCAQLRTRMAGQVSLASVDRLCSAHAADMLCARCAQAAGMLRAAHGRTSSEKFCQHFCAW